MTDTPTERSHPDLWVDPEDDPRETGTPVTGERDLVLGPASRSLGSVHDLVATTGRG
jgi:hypothetical protein